MTPEELQTFDESVIEMLASITPIQPQEPAPPKPEANPFDSLPPEVVVIASTSPAFSENLSSWEMRLRNDGFLTQERHSFLAGKWQTAVRRAYVGPTWVQMFLRRADELDFWNLSYEVAMIVTDVGSESLAIRSGDKWRAWRPECPWFHAREGHDGAQKFMELWDLISAQGPLSNAD